MANEPKTAKKASGFTDEEKAAMRERAKEMKASTDKADMEKAVLEKIAGFPEPDRTLSKRLHAIVKANFPTLSCKLWYGFPAYTKDDEIIFFFQNASKFKVRYATLGFSDEAHLDEGAMWPTVYALTRLTAAEEAKVIALVKKALS